MQTQTPILPQRKPLPHGVPSWVSPDARYFITIAAADRESEPFADADRAAALLRGLRYYDEIGRWYLWTATIMPDHLHFIATFNHEPGIEETMRSWKAYQTRTLGVAFQERYFEHRLRDQNEFREKFEYIRLNPVSKGLVALADDWRFSWSR